MAHAAHRVTTVVMRRIGSPHSWGTMMVVFGYTIINLRGACLNLTLLAIDKDISCFAWDGSQEGVRNILSSKCHKSKSAASLGNAVNHDNRINYISKLFKEIKEPMVCHYCTKAKQNLCEQR